MMSYFFGHNFRTVYRFEVIRTLKKKSFWLSVLALPALITLVFGVVIFANKQASDSTKNLSEQQFSIAITDDSGQISDSVAKIFNVKTISNKEDGIDAVKNGSLDAYFYYPGDLSSSEVEVFGKNVGIFENSRYESVAQLMLKQSVMESTKADTVSVLSGEVDFTSTTFRDGKKYDPAMEMIAPGIFLILLYVIIAIFGNQMLNSTIEEKENRVIEIILTTIKSRTLIVGKIFALFTLVMIQVIIILGLILVAYYLLKDNLDLPNIDLSKIPLDWPRIIAAVSIFFGSILLLSGLLVAIGAAVPTAKEASQFFGIVMVLIYGPLYAAPLFITNTDSIIVTIISFFPFTAPIPLLIRNAVGNLSTIETVIGVLLLLIFAALVFILAAKLFQTGAVEYDRKISIKWILPNKFGSKPKK